MTSGKLYLIGTADTKSEELDYLRTLAAQAGAEVQLVDVGTRPSTIAVDIASREVAAFHPGGAGAIFGTEDRGVAVSAMAEAFARFIASRNDIGGILGIGGGGGTSIITAGMREVSVGLPKLMVSTLASGDVGAFVGASDIAMMYSVTDMAGLNRISRTVLRNAANAIAAMVRGARSVRSRISVIDGQDVERRVWVCTIRLQQSQSLCFGCEKTEKLLAFAALCKHTNGTSRSNGARQM